MLRAVILAISLLFSPLASGGEPGKKMPRIGFLQPNAGNAPSMEAFRMGLRDNGLIEGENVLLEIRAANGNYDLMPALAAKLMQWKPDVLVTVAPYGVDPLRSLTQALPIVVISCDSADSMVKSIARPGGNITGVTCMDSDLNAKRLQLLKAAAPQIRNVAVLFNAVNPMKIDEVRQMESAATMLGLVLHPVAIKKESELEEGIARAVRNKAEALYVFNDPLIFRVRKQVVELEAKYNLPACYSFKEYVASGGLMSYGTMQDDLFRRAATYVGKILKGAKPADLPVEQASHFEFVVNAKTAKTIRLAIPPSVLERADRVIE